MKKIFPIVFLLFVVLSVATIPTISKRNVIRTNLEVEQKEMEYPNRIYLLDENNYFVEIPVQLTESTIENVIEMLKENNSSTYHGYLPKTLKVLGIEEKEDHVQINLSEAISEEAIPGLIHSILQLGKYKTIELRVNNELIKGFERPMDKSIPMNKEVQIHNRREIEKVVIYYMEDPEKNYLVPVTKYIDSKEDKIKVILEELKSNIPKNLISYLDNKVELIDYEMDKDSMILNFNQEFGKDKSIKSKIVKEMARSIFENYDVSAILFKVNGKLDQIITNNG